MVNIAGSISPSLLTPPTIIFSTILSKTARSNSVSIFCEDSKCLNSVSLFFTSISDFKVVSIFTFSSARNSFSEEISLYFSLYMVSLIFPSSLRFTRFSSFFSNVRSLFVILFSSLLRLLSFNSDSIVSSKSVIKFSFE